MRQDVPQTQDDDQARHGVLLSMCLALVLVVASVSSVNLALRGISVDLGTSSSQLTWIADGYTVALAALVLPFGALGDRIGRRTLLLLGTILFGLGAAAAAAAGSAGVLIGCRVAMGAGAAMIMPGTLSTITAAFPANRRSRAVSVWAGFASAGGILGMLGSGLILEWFSWRGTFVATAALAVVAFVAAAKLAPNTADPDEAVTDLPGSILSGVGIGALVLGIIEGAEVGWAGPGAVAGLGVAAVVLVAFVLWELRTARPMLDVRLFRLRGFGTGTVALTVQFLCLFGFFFVGLQFLQLVLGYSALISAVSLLPMAAIVLPMSRIAPHLVERFGPRAVMTAGLTALAAGLGMMAQLSSDSSYWQFLGGLAIFGLGMSLTSTPATTAIVSSLPLAKQGVGSAVNDVSREVGSAVGIAILGSLFNAGYGHAVGAVTTQLPAEAARAVEESPGAGLAVASSLGPAGAQLAESVQAAFAAGLADAMTAGAVIALAGAVFTLWRAPRRGAHDVVVERDPVVAAGTTSDREAAPTVMAA
jgi:EmrB/QacA subfamily drug resistance transporter